MTEGQGQETEESSDDASCPIGGEGCACTPGGGCDPGLSCEAGLCLAADETDTGACSELGCACEDDQDCDAGLKCAGGSCVIDDCGNGALDDDEVCDDGNGVDGDGCDNDCTRTEILDITAGGAHTCVLIEGGRIRCWGNNLTGQVGYGAPETIGDNETPAAIGDLPLPPAVEIEAGGTHTCARFEDGSVRCWGLNTLGQLGYGNTLTVYALGDDETLDGLETLSLGGSTDQLVVGVLQSCVRAGGSLRCWGVGDDGQLGTGATDNIGDDELPDSVGAMDIGAQLESFSLGGAHGCGLTVTGTVRCWGRNDRGQLGYGSNMDIGDDEAPAEAGEVSVLPDTALPGTVITAVELGLNHSCALTSTREVICWGHNGSGQLGQGNLQNWGAGVDELPAKLPPVSLGGPTAALAAGYDHTCALLVSGKVRCWGANSSGQLGQGNEDTIGDNELPDTVEPVDLGGNAIALASGTAHTCAVLENHRVICWGDNGFGQLGYGFSHDIGDNESPVVAGFIDLL
ncbi:MAG: hypothetical protein KC457_29035 [Myxococcales bacterium]|nr:hypothetical protein [Myxococcales bacterium]